MRLDRISLLVIFFLSLLALAPQDGFKRERNGKNDLAKNDLEGKAPPSLVGEWLNTQGKPLTWESLKGKVVVLDFWTHWSLPSRDAIPHIRLLLSKYASKGLTVIAVHSDPNKAKMEQAVRQLGITWPVLLDAKKVNLKLYSADSFSDYYLVDRKGTLRIADLANEELDRAVEALLAESP